MTPRRIACVAFPARARRAAHLGANIAVCSAVYRQRRGYYDWRCRTGGYGKHAVAGGCRGPGRSPFGGIKRIGHGGVKRCFCLIIIYRGQNIAFRRASGVCFSSYSLIYISYTGGVRGARVGSLDPPRAIYAAPQVILVAVVSVVPRRRIIRLPIGGRGLTACHFTEERARGVQGKTRRIGAIGRDLTFKAGCIYRRDAMHPQFLVGRQIAVGGVIGSGHFPVDAKSAGPFAAICIYIAAYVVYNCIVNIVKSHAQERLTALCRAHIGRKLIGVACADPRRGSAKLHDVQGFGG